MASVDVVVPCYQYGRFLRGCVASILNQGITDVRVLIIDNASTDDSAAVARRLSAENGRISVVARPVNLGLHASFNEGIDWATADYFMVLYADDLLAPGSLARALPVMERHPEVVLAFGREMVVGPEDLLPADEPHSSEADWRILPGPQLLERLCRTGRPDEELLIIGSSATLVRTSAQKRAGHFRPKLAHTSDFEMWLRLARLGAAAQTDLVQGIRRVHPASRSSAGIRNVHMWNLHYEAAFESFFAHEGALLPDPKSLQRTARRALSERAYWGSGATLLRGDLGLALQLLRFALTRWPASAVIPPVGYLFRRKDTLSHFGALLSAAAKRLLGRMERRPVGGQHAVHRD
jgi:glycosyltransferase involved in cell wall biosynthesis